MLTAPRAARYTRCMCHGLKALGVQLAERKAVLMQEWQQAA